LALIDMGLYRRFYRQKNTLFADAVLRGIGSSSIKSQDTGEIPNRQPPQASLIR
jgi:hypothetical protein